MLFRRNKIRSRLITNNSIFITYDAAGNHSTSGYTYDYLNRMTASTGFTYTHDAVGNRTVKHQNNTNWGDLEYTWDALNRLSMMKQTNSGLTYKYRADGMRVAKIEDLSGGWMAQEELSGSGDENVWNNPTTRYFYDGQMCIEEDTTINPSNGADPYVDDVTQYGIGARGIDFMRVRTNVENKTSLPTPTDKILYPVYDAHGNMVASLAKSSGGYAVSNQRTFDAWGGVRDSDSASKKVNTRYCGNLGHKQDDETGLIYMRARYYEPTSGRFISEDPGRDGSNWYVYCHNEPVYFIDNSGNGVLEDIAYFFAGNGLVAAGALLAFNSVNPAARLAGISMILLGAVFIYHAAAAFPTFDFGFENKQWSRDIRDVVGLVASVILPFIILSEAGMKVGVRSLAMGAVIGIFSYAVTCLMFAVFYCMDDPHS